MILICLYVYYHDNSLDMIKSHILVSFVIISTSVIDVASVVVFIFQRASHIILPFYLLLLKCN